MRKLFITTRIFIQAFVRRTVWMVFLAFGLLFTLGCYLFVYRGQVNLALQETVYGQVMLTLTFMMMGIELIREQRQENMDDIVATYSKSPKFFPWAQVLAIGFFALLITFLIMAGCYMRMAIDGAPSLWIKQSLAYITLLYFLPCWILGIWGLLISKWNKGKSVYLPAMLVWVLTSSLLTYMTYYTEALGFGSGGFIFNVLNMGMNNFHIPGNVSTGPPIELPRWIVRIGIMVLLTALFISENVRGFASTRQKKRIAWIKVASVIVFSIVLMTFFHQRYSVFFTKFANPEDAKNYIRRKNDEYISREQVNLINFSTKKSITLKKTDIDLYCTTQGINVEVNMEAIMDTDATEQAFTLYSDLVVDEVWVDGKKTEFERDNDGLNVHFSGIKNAGDKVNFVFRYHGYILPSFPANETTVQLNCSFPWMPWPGIKTTNMSSYYYELGPFLIEDWQQGDNVEYVLNYHGPGNLYTNLNQFGDNLYRGASDNGVSLYSGMIHCRYRDVDIYMPANQYKYIYLAVDALLDAYDPLLDLCEKMETIRKPETPRSIVVIQMRCPMLNEFVKPQEIYTRDDEWEIRQYNDLSGTILSRMRYSSQEEYKVSDEVAAEIAVPYVLNPCVGYPVDASYSSTVIFSAWLSSYIRAPRCDDSDLEFIIDRLKESYSENVPKNEKDHINEIIDRMHGGENFDEPFKALYHRLLQGEAVTACDLVTQLYNYHQGE